MHSFDCNPFNWCACKCGWLFHDLIAKSNYRNHTFELFYYCLCVDNVIVCQLFYLSRIWTWKETVDCFDAPIKMKAFGLGPVWENATNALMVNVFCFISYIDIWSATIWTFAFNCHSIEFGWLAHVVHRNMNINKMNADKHLICIYSLLFNDSISTPCCCDLCRSRRSFVDCSETFVGILIWVDIYCTASVRLGEWTIHRFICTFIRIVFVSTQFCWLKNMINYCRPNESHFFFSFFFF